jgi:coenzyme F420-reducing hydrogenase beta subunit
VKSYFIEKDKSKCTGCRCCQYICPVSAISMVRDEEGFLYPVVDEDICVNCGLCETRCPIASDNVSSVKRLEQPLVYASNNKDKLVLKKSSSGGMFSVLAESILNKGGAVVGCVFDEALNPTHIIAETKTQIARMRGSKYIQSDTQDTFPETKKILESGRWVLYTGTPCQIAGLRSYLKIDYEKLITVDLVCHGVPSNALFQEYLSWLECKLKGKVVDYRFRDKTKYGWASVGSFTYIKNNKPYIKQLLPEKDYYYYYYYLSGNIYRESCYVCRFASPYREGDLTIADYWDIQKYHSEFYPPAGVSMVVVNTKKGKQMFNEIANNIEYIPSKLEYALKANGNLNKPTFRPETRDFVYADIKKLGFEIAAKKYCNLKRITPTIKRVIPYKVKVVIKKLLRKL